MSKGLLIVLSGPSGTGKGTVCDELLKRNKDIFFQSHAQHVVQEKERSKERVTTLSPSSSLKTCW